MLNPRLNFFADYTFDRLRALLDPIAPPAGIAPLALAIGEPQHTPPAMIKEILGAAGPEWGKYPMIDGTPDFRAAVGDWLTRRYHLEGSGFDADSQVLPVAGTREVLFLAALLSTPEEKDGRRPLAFMPNPFYQVYLGGAAMAGAEPRYMPCTEDTGWLPDLNALSADDLDRTSVMYLCSPANPQGAMADMDYLKTAIRLARKHDFVLCSDECYAEIYTDTPPPGALQACAELAAADSSDTEISLDSTSLDGTSSNGTSSHGSSANSPLTNGPFSNVLVFHSLSKRSSAPGLRSGFVAGDPVLSKNLKRLRAFGGATVALPVLEASAALWRDEAHVIESREKYRRKFDDAERILGSDFGFYRPDGGFFLWLNVGDGEKAAQTLWREQAIRVLPGKYLSADDASGNSPGDAYIRIALVHEPDITADALERIKHTLRVAD